MIMRARRFFAVLLLAVSFCSGAADDSALTRRAADLAELLRCLVCQNQTIADSNAELAQDLRRQILEQLRAGRSDREILDFMVARYGDFVLYKPPVKASTVALWGGPFVLLAIGAVVLWRFLSRRRESVGATDLTPEQRALAQQLLEGSDAKR